MEHRPIAIPIAALETNIVPSNVWKKYINTEEIVCKKNAEKKNIRIKKTIQKRKGKMYTTKEQAHPQRHS